ncbi:MAG: hypothetical protein H0X40_02520 [Chthoniobacterales bacterium]|nr:hypothetical protein [Chthoniobacterales bacterium]
MVERAPNDEWNGAFQRAAAERDWLLDGVPALGRARRAALRAVLTSAFPVEAALCEVAARRDRLLAEYAREIPHRVTGQLHLCLTNLQLRRDRHATMRWGRLLPLAACFLIGLGAAFLGKWEATSARLPAVSRRDDVVLQQLTLRLSAAELASWRATSLAVNPVSERDDASAPTRLRIDLPVQALLGENAIAHTP